MAETFISYASEDRDFARELADTLKQLGYDVWWDRELIVGEVFRAVIHRELTAAASVIVIWSRHAVASTWVVEEATVAHERGVYLPVCIDETPPPLGLGSAQYAKLGGWSGALDDSEFRRLLNGVSRLSGKPIVGEPHPPAGLLRTLLAGFRQRRGLTAALSALPALGLLGLLAVLQRVEHPTQVDLELAVAQATVTFRDPVDSGLLSSHPSATLTVDGFLEANLGEASYPSETKLGPVPLRLIAVDPPATATFHNVQSEGIRIPGGTPLSLAWRADRLTLSTPRAPLSINLTSEAAVAVACDGCAVASVAHGPVPLSSSALSTFSFAGRKTIPVTTQGPQSGLALDVGADMVVLSGDWQVDDLDFTRPSSKGNRESAVLSGELKFATLQRNPVPVGPGTFVVAKSLSDFYLTNIAITPRGLTLSMHGVTGNLHVGGAGAIRSLLPSSLEVMMTRSAWVVYASTAAALSLLAWGLITARARRA